MSDLNPDAPIFNPSTPFIPIKHVSQEVAEKVLDEINVEESKVIIYSTFNSLPHLKQYDIEYRWYTPKNDSKSSLSRTAFFQLYKDKLPLAGFNYQDVDAIEYFLRGLTSTYTGQIDLTGEPLKKYYNIQAITCSIGGIDNAFLSKFMDPNKRWKLRMDPRAMSHGWKNIEVSFVIPLPSEG